MLPRHRLQTGADANVLGQVATLALSYLMVTGVSANYQQVMALVRQRGLQFAGVTHINAISPADLADVVRHVQTSLVDASSPGSQLHLARFQPGGLGLGTPLADPLENWITRALLEGRFGRLDGEQGGPSGLSGRRDYAGLSSSGDVSPTSFMTSRDPQAIMLRGMGMSEGTYSALYNDGFRMRHIVPAARAAQRLDLNVNDPRVVRPFAVIRANVPPAEANRIEGNFGLLQAGLRGDPRFGRAVLELDAARASGDAERIRLAQAQLNGIVGEHRRRHGITDDIARQHNRDVQRAIDEAASLVVNGEEMYVRELIRRLGPDAASRTTVSAHLATLSDAERREFMRRAQERAREAPTILGAGAGTARQEGAGLTGLGLVAPTTPPPTPDPVQPPPDAGAGGTARQEGQDLVAGGLVVPPQRRPDGAAPT